MIHPRCHAGLGRARHSRGVTLVELLIALERLENLLDRYPVRGLKGAVGTQLDQLTLLGGRADRVAELEGRILRHLGFRAPLIAVGQVYPRSLDFDVVSALHQVGAAAADTQRRS